MLLLAWLLVVFIYAVVCLNVGFCCVVLIGFVFCNSVVWVGVLCFEFIVLCCLRLLNLCLLRLIAMVWVGFWFVCDLFLGVCFWVSGGLVWFARVVCVLNYILVICAFVRFFCFDCWFCWFGVVWLVWMVFVLVMLGWFRFWLVALYVKCCFTWGGLVYCLVFCVVNSVVWYLLFFGFWFLIMFDCVFFGCVVSWLFAVGVLLCCFCCLLVLFWVVMLFCIWLGVVLYCRVGWTFGSFDNFCSGFGLSLCSFVFVFDFSWLGLVCWFCWIWFVFCVIVVVWYFWCVCGFVYCIVDFCFVFLWVFLIWVILIWVVLIVNLMVCCFWVYDLLVLVGFGPRLLCLGLYRRNFW